MSRSGVIVALAVLLADQAHKWWMLVLYDIEAKGRVAVAPFLDLVMVWNRGISYGLFQQNHELGRWVLIAFSAAAIIVLALWLRRAGSRPTAVGLGLVMGGAASNMADRLVHGAVADFFLLHAGDFSWYVFNLADAAIVAGVAALLYDSLFGRHGEADGSQ